MIFPAASDLGVSGTKWGASICCCFFPFWLLLITGGVRRQLSAGLRRGEQVYVPVCFLWTSGAMERVELFMQRSWQEKNLSDFWGCWRADGSTEIQKETISEFLLNDAARKGDVLWALWPQWPILTSPSLPVLSSWLSPLWPTSQPEEPCPIPHTQVQLLQADGQSDTPVSLAGLSIFRGHSRNNVHFNNSVADTD